MLFAANDAHGDAQHSHEEEDDMACVPPPTPPRKTTMSVRDMPDIEAHDVDAVTRQMEALFDENEGSDEESEDEEDDSPILTEDAAMEANYGPEADGFMPKEPYEFMPEEPENTAPDTWIRDQFRAYCDHAKKNFHPFTEHEVTTIRLLHLLQQKNAPMNAYEPLMLWHLKQGKKLHEQQGLGDYEHYIGRKKMLKKLRYRYNYENKLPYLKTMKLPVSGTVVRLTLHNAKATIQRLLTDPRLKGMDYMFWDGNLCPRFEHWAGIPANLCRDDRPTGTATVNASGNIHRWDSREPLP